MGLHPQSPALPFLIVVVIGGIIGGVFTATEGSAIAVIYALILGILYRNITFKILLENRSRAAPR